SCIMLLFCVLYLEIFNFIYVCRKQGNIHSVYFWSLEYWNIDSLNISTIPSFLIKKSDVVGKP
ncbi:MAG: hypothetical protein KAW86_08235, partial [Bacteroidales bacterium]|nr:hypothetical protein [Bacteroidales bacterium]